MWFTRSIDTGFSVAPHPYTSAQAQQSCDYLHRFVLEHVQSRDGAHDQEKAPMSPDPFLACVMGSGNKTRMENA